MSGIAVLVDSDGVVATGAAAGVGPPGLLEGVANGAYTTALMRGSPLCVVDWDLHEQRLVRSLSILADQEGPKAPALLLVKQRACIAVSKYVALLAEQQQQQHQECSAMLFIYVACGPPGPPRVMVHCKPYQQPAAQAPVQVAVVGPPRDPLRAHAKYSAWMQERRPIEDRKPKDVAEVLLSDVDGSIMEGMLTNFCVIADRQDGCGSCLMTSSPDQPALPGIMLARVLEACHCLGLPVVRQPPKASDRHFWKEAFITNCLRGIQPIAHITCPADNLCKQQAWDFSLPLPHGDITQQLQQKVQELQVLTKLI